MFVKKGYERTTVLELAQAFGRSKGGLYHYVRSKKAIRDLIINHHLSNIRECLSQIEDVVANHDITEALRKSIDIYFKNINEHQDTLIFVHHLITVLPLKEKQVLYDDARRVVHCFERILIKGVEAGEFKVDDPRLVAHDILAIGTAWADRRWFLRKLYTLQEYTEKTTNHIFNVIGSGAGLSLGARQ